MAPRVAVTDRPVVTLGMKPALKSVDDLNTALLELSFIEARSKSLDGHCQERLDQVKADYQTQKHIVIDTEPVPFADRRKLLLEAIEKYCEKNRAKLLEGDAKSRKMTNGCVSWTTKPARIGYAENERATLGVLDQLVELTASIVKFLGRMGLVGSGKSRVSMWDLVDLKPQINLTRVNDAYKSGRLPEDELDGLALAIIPETETFSVKPAEYTLRSETTTPA